jgi:hypothetical protein
MLFTTGVAYLIALAHALGKIPRSGLARGEAMFRERLRC